MPKPIISLKIDVKKIAKEHLYVGAKGTYLDITLMEKDGGGVDEYGNAGFITQSVSKEARERNERGPIIGNYRLIQLREKVNLTPPKNRPPVAARPQADPDLDAAPDGDFIPFMFPFAPFIAGLSTLAALSV